ncbi:MAG: hypothetical protein IKP37_12080 [Paludibacteraceae bacterium]|nr:hypothetical protein [Paludibacteraceae bacterium]
MKKRIALTCMVLAVAASGFSQKKMVGKAKNALIEPVDLVEAKTSIDAAMSNEETSSDPNTYVVAGKVYKAIYNAEVKKKLLNQPYDEKLMTTSLFTAVNCYTNAAELEQVPDAKGKTTDKYDKEIKKSFKELQDPLIADGYTALQQSNYKAALMLFEGYMSIPNCSIMREEPVDTTYNTVQFLAINAALLNKDNKKAIKYMSELKDANYYKGATIYEWMVDALQAEKDTAKSLEILEEGLKKYPTNSYMIGKQVNYYIDHGKKQEAMNYLDNAIAANPKDVEYLNVKASIYLSDKNFAEALNLYQKACSINANKVESVEGVGVTYCAMAVDEDQKADKIKSDAAWKKARTAAEDTYRKAEEYLEKAKAMYEKPNKDNLYWLGIVYNRLKKADKYKEIQNLRNSL